MHGHISNIAYAMGLACHQLYCLYMHVYVCVCLPCMLFNLVVYDVIVLVYNMT